MGSRLRCPPPTIEWLSIVTITTSSLDTKWTQDVDTIYRLTKVVSVSTKRMRWSSLGGHGVMYSSNDGLQYRYQSMMLVISNNKLVVREKITY